MTFGSINLSLFMNILIMILYKQLIKEISLKVH